MPEPTPVPKVITIKFFMPRATPYIISPMAAAFASLVSATGMPPSPFENISASGTTPLRPQAKFGANSIVPL